MKKVSIVIPMFNAEKYIEATLHSVLMQTWANKEILVVDDGSTDQSVRIVESYEKKGITLLRQQNKGACAARNLGFLNSTGDYIQYLDADDLLSPNKIELQMSLLQGCDETVMASSPWVKFHEDLNKGLLKEQYINRSYDSPKQWLIDSWEGRGMGVVHGWLCHRNLLKAAGEWDEKLQINQDGDFFCRVLLKASAIRFCKEAVAYYRTANVNSISKGKSYEKASSLLKTYLSYKQNMLKHESSAEAQHAMMKNFLNFIYEYYPRYHDLIEIADQNIKELGFKKYEIVGGKNFKKLAGIVGFYPALRLRTLFGGK